MAVLDHLAAHQRAPRSRLIEALSAGLGPAEAARVVHATADWMGFGPELSRDEALRVLDHLAAKHGVVGVSASFTKSHVHLLWCPARPL